MEMNINVTDMERVFPLAGVDDGYILSRCGDVTVGWELTLPAALYDLLVALPVLLMMTQLFDAGCTLINSCGDTVASMLVTRVLYGKDWYKKNLNKQEEAKI